MTLFEAVENEDSDVRRLRADGVAELARYFDRNRRRLKKCVHTRIDRRLLARMDESDIVQETFVEAAERLNEYLDNPRMPLFVWLRFLAQQTTAARHRQFYGTQKRDPDREIATGEGAEENLIEELTTSMISPHSAVVRAEVSAKIRELVTAMPTNDREILTMVHLEELSLPEAAAAMKLAEETVRKRHFRAISRLRSIVRTLESEEN